MFRVGLQSENEYLFFRDTQSVATVMLLENDAS